MGLTIPVNSASVRMHIGGNMAGRQIDDICFACQTGRLQPVLELPSTHVERHLKHGPVGSKEAALRRIEFLACERCKRLYLAADRGKDLVTVLGPKTEGFKNPPEQPETCPCCQRELSHGGYVPEKFRQELNLRADESPSPATSFKYQRLFRYCEETGRIHWVQSAQAEET